MDLSGSLTQYEFADLIGVSQPAVSEMLRRGVLQKGDSAKNWLLAYCKNLREVAAGRVGVDGELDLVTERAKLTRAQNERLEFQNAILRRENGPIIELEQGLADCLATISSQLETIPGKLKKSNPALTANDLNQARQVIASVRNELATLSIDWFGDASKDGGAENLDDVAAVSE